MLIQIIKHTPPWVFALFFILLIMGYKQSKDRNISRRKIALLPTLMTGLSIYGIISAFGLGQLLCWVSWLSGFLIPGIFIIKLSPLREVSYSKENLSFFIPGSWLPLFLMMTIFSIKYVVGVILAKELPIINEDFFILAVSLSYGLISGIFFFRAFTIWYSSKKQ